MDVVARPWTIAMAMSQHGGQKQKADGRGVHDDGLVVISGCFSKVTFEGISMSGLDKE